MIVLSSEYVLSIPERRLSIVMFLPASVQRPSGGGERRVGVGGGLGGVGRGGGGGGGGGAPRERRHALALTRPVTVKEVP